MESLHINHNLYQHLLILGKHFLCKLILIYVNNSKLFCQREYNVFQLYSLLLLNYVYWFLALNFFYIFPDIQEIIKKQFSIFRQNNQLMSSQFRFNLEVNGCRTKCERAATQPLKATCWAELSMQFKNKTVFYQ